MQKRPHGCKLNITARENTWSNQRRLKRQKLKGGNSEEKKSSETLVKDGRLVEKTKREEIDSEMNSKPETSQENYLHEKIERKFDEKNCSEISSEKYEYNKNTANEVKIDSLNQIRTKAVLSPDERIHPNASNHIGLESEGTACTEPSRKRARRESNIASDLNNELNTNNLGGDSNRSKNDATVIDNRDYKQMQEQLNADRYTVDNGKRKMHDLCNIGNDDQKNLIENESHLKSDNDNLCERDLGSSVCRTSIHSERDSSVIGNSENCPHLLSVEENCSKAPLVVCNLLIEKLDHSASGNQVAIEIIWMSGTGSRDLPHQIMQYLKNNL